MHRNIARFLSLALLSNIIRPMGLICMSEDGSRQKGALRRMFLWLIGHDKMGRRESCYDRSLLLNKSFLIPAIASIFLVTDSFRGQLMFPRIGKTHVGCVLIHQKSPNRRPRPLSRFRSATFLLWSIASAKQLLEYFALMENAPFARSLY